MVSTTPPPEHHHRLPPPPTHGRLRHWLSPLRSTRTNIPRPRAAAPIGDPAQALIHYTHLLHSPATLPPPPPKSHETATAAAAAVRETVVSPPPVAPETPDKGKRLSGECLLNRATTSSELEEQEAVKGDGGVEEKQAEGSGRRPTRPKKKKKHRPKVIQEVKPAARTLKPATPQQAKEKLNRTTPMPKNEVCQEAVNTASGKTDVQSHNKSVKRSLNFDSELVTVDVREILTGNANTEILAREACASISTILGSGSRSTVKLTDELEVVVENSEAGFAFDLNRSLNHVLEEYLRSPPESTTPPPARTSRRGLMRGNLEQLDKTRLMRSHGCNPNCLESTAGNPTPVGPPSRRELIRGNLKRFDQELVNSNCLSRTERDLNHVDYAENCCGGIQRDVHFVEACNDEIGQARKCHEINSFFPKFSEIDKRRKIENGQAREYTQEVQHNPSYVTYCDQQRQIALGKVHFLEGMLASSQSERKTKKRSELPTRVRNLASMAPVIEHNQTVRNPDKPQGLMEALLAEGCLRAKTKSRTKKGQVHPINSISSNINQEGNSSPIQKFVSSAASSSGNSVVKHSDHLQIVPFQDKHISKDFQESLRASLWSQAIVPYNKPVDSELDFLDINQHQLDTPWQPQNTVVRYGGGGMTVSYKGPLDPTKKRHSRPKVDLDPETDRVWNLLMGNQICGEDNGADKDKQKWWEEQRRVFRGRVDLFIARMHLIQGDRRFSRWKGSVVDSVVGVFLTQNVSDHLSSSAFMSLAASFPARSRCKHGEPDKEQMSTSGDQVKENILTIDDTIKWKEKMQGPEERDEGFVWAYEAEHSEKRDMSDISISLRDNTEGGDAEEFHANQCRLQLGQEIREQVQEIPEQVRLSLTGIEYPSTSHQMHSLSNTRLVQTEKVGVVREENSSLLASFEVTHSDNMSLKAKFEATGQHKLTTAHAVESHASIREHSPQLIHFSEIEVSEKQYCCHNNIPGDITDLSLSNEFQSSLDEHRGKCQQKSQREAFLEVDTQHAVRILSQTQQHNMQPPCTYSCETSNIVKQVKSCLKYEVCSPQTVSIEIPRKASRAKALKKQTEKDATDWESLRREAYWDSSETERSIECSDLLDWEAVRSAHVGQISKTIEERGMHNMLGQRIKDFLNRMVNEHGSIDLEWLRKVPPDRAKEFLQSIRGLGLKSAECVRLLTLEQHAFPVDTNVGRICVRLGWVPLQPLPESTQLHLLELYPMLEAIQKYLWPRLCNLDQRTLYELHYQMITFGKVFCTKRKPNCNACPMRAECKHFACEFASTRLMLPGPGKENLERSSVRVLTEINSDNCSNKLHPPQLEGICFSQGTNYNNCGPIIEEPTTPEPECIASLEKDIEDYGDPDEIPCIDINKENLTQHIWNFAKANDLDLLYDELSTAIVSMPAEAASIPMPKLKKVTHLRTEHQVYELTDEHPLLKGVDQRISDDPCPYLLAIWTPGETAESAQSPETCCNSNDRDKLCDDKICLRCNSIREGQAQIVRGTLLIPCRTAMRGSFPLNGTYFQVNEVFADHASSCEPMCIPREWIWNLPRRTVYIGTSIPTIFRGMSTDVIQHCFWRGYICLRGFDQNTRRPMPLTERLHRAAYKTSKRFQQQRVDHAGDGQNT